MNSFSRLDAVLELLDQIEADITFKLIDQVTLIKVQKASSIIQTELNTGVAKLLKDRKSMKSAPKLRLVK